MYPLTTKRGFLMCALKIQVGRISYSYMHGFISAKLDMLSMPVLTREVLASQIQDLMSINIKPDPDAYASMLNFKYISICIETL